MPKRVVPRGRASYGEIREGCREEVVNGKLKTNSPSYSSVSQELVKWPRCGGKKRRGLGVGHQLLLEMGFISNIKCVLKNQPHGSVHPI